MNPRDRDSDVCAGGNQDLVRSGRLAFLVGDRVHNEVGIVGSFLGDRFNGREKTKSFVESSGGEALERERISEEIKREVRLTHEIRKSGVRGRRVGTERELGFMVKFLLILGLQAEKHERRRQRMRRRFCGLRSVSHARASTVLATKASIRTVTSKQEDVHVGEKLLIRERRRGVLVVVVRGNQRTEEIGTRRDSLSALNPTLLNRLEQVAFELVEEGTRLSERRDRKLERPLW